MDLSEKATRYALLPLRLFLGVTFIYAGLDKLTDSHYLAGLSDPTSFASMTQGIKSGSPIGPLLDLALKAPTGFALAIAIGELAVGLGALFGLFGRVAALGGVLLNLSFFLTVSWQVQPYYLGNDLIYLMAWVPLLLAGMPYLSLDGWLASRRRRPSGAQGLRPDSSSSSPSESRSVERSS
jgi:thiosulfate dehydrogenase [quinone] large subunit